MMKSCSNQANKPAYGKPEGGMVLEIGLNSERLCPLGYLCP